MVFEECLVRVDLERILLIDRIQLYLIDLIQGNDDIHKFHILLLKADQLLSALAQENSAR